jgi:hypothetical protein
MRTLQTILAYIALSFIVGGFISVPAITQTFGLALVESVCITIGLVTPVLAIIHQIDKWLDMATTKN